MDPLLLESLIPSAGADVPVPPVARRPAHLVGSTPVLWIDGPFAPRGRGFHAKLEGAIRAASRTGAACT